MTFTPSLLRTRKDLITALKDKGLPASIPRLNTFEEMRVIKFPKYGLKRGMNGFDRLYTEAEIERAVKSVEEYVGSKKQFGNVKNTSTISIGKKNMNDARIAVDRNGHINVK